MLSHIAGYQGGMQAMPEAFYMRRLMVPAVSGKLDALSRPVGQLANILRLPIPARHHQQSNGIMAVILEADQSASALDPEFQASHHEY